MNKIIPSENLQDINYFSAQIRSTAKDALNEQIHPSSAKDEISDLIEIINKLKKEGK